MCVFDLASVQAAIREHGFDGWLLYDFRGSNILARRVLGMTDGFQSRRWYYFIPAQGEPRKLVHRIESGALDAYPGTKDVYVRWQELETEIGRLVAGAKRIAMEYVPRNTNPYISRVDAGTIELVRSFGPEIGSSGDLVQTFEATWDDEQWALHREAAIHTDSAYDVAFGAIAGAIRSGQAIRESDVIRIILDHFDRNGLTTDHGPNCSVGPHSGDPHYETTPATDVMIQPGDFVLIDLWAKSKKPRGVYSDLTRVAFVGAEIPAKIAEIFGIVASARDAAIACVKDGFAAGTPVFGWQVDAAARGVIEKAGYGAFFVHRTGHSIGQEVHGNGANMDGLETREDRTVMRRTCFSIEPGIYFPEWGVRSEVDVFVDVAGQVHVTGGKLQTEVVRIV
jgi:Xaa-Pro aminopeptidase